MAWLDCAASHGLTINYLGGWNEKGYNATWYKNLRSALNSRGYSSVKIVASDDFGWGAADESLRDPAFANAVQVFGSHYVCGYRSAQTSCPSSGNAVSTGKSLWASENGSDDYNAGAQALARGINRGYIDGKMTGYINWPVIAAITPNIPWATTGVAVAPAALVRRLLHRQERLGDGADHPVHRPGLALPRRVERLPRRQPQQRQLRLAEVHQQQRLQHHHRDDGRRLARRPSTSPSPAGCPPAPCTSGRRTSGRTTPPTTSSGATTSPRAAGAFSLTVQPGYVYSITTTTGQGKGTATSPAQGTLKLPYSDTSTATPSGARRST